MSTASTRLTNETQSDTVQMAAETAQRRQDFYSRIDRLSLAPVWKVLKGLIPNEPTPVMVPHVWDF
ncbi:MAG: hypothetical protein ABIQ03_12545, partial [Burkholderiales bacterium]